MALHLELPLAGGRQLHVVHTDATDGDFGVDSDPVTLHHLRRTVVDLPWTWLRQVHGADVVLVDAPGVGAGRQADAAVTSVVGSTLAVTTADCAPVVLVADRGVAVVHAGWRGLLSGVIDRAAGVLAEVGGQPRGAILGPCINPASYEFGAADLERVAETLGPEVRATTRWETPALDLPAAVAAACRKAGWPPPQGPRPPCTSDTAYFSHRTRHDAGRQATVAWIVAGHDQEDGS